MRTITYVKSLDRFGYPGYSVSSDGKIYSDKIETELKPKITNGAYGMPQVCLYVDGIPYMRFVSRLVAEAFLDKPFPQADVVLHKNRNRSDCRVENLAWRNRVFNVEYYGQPARTNISDEGPVLCYTPQGVYEFRNVREAGEAFGLLDRNIYFSILNREPPFFEPNLRFEFISRGRRAG